MSNINQTVILRGYVAKEVNVYSNYRDNNGKDLSVGSLTLAIQNSTNDSDFIPITVFANTCELLKKYTKKGTQILMSCKIKNNIYTKKEGNKTVYKGGIQIQCEEFQILSQPIEEKSNKKGKHV